MLVNGLPLISSAKSNFTKQVDENLPRNLSGTAKDSFVPRLAGYGEPGWFLESW